MFKKITLAMMVMAFAIGTASAGGPGSANGYVKAAAKKYNVSYRLARAVCRTESQCSCTVRRGRAGEIGPMQVLPRTARGINGSLKGCKNQVYTGVKYLSKARRGVWQYNQGIYAKRRSKAGARYQRKVESNM
jgi:soluble lytic murein transglycosylase-like protein